MPGKEKCIINYTNGVFQGDNSSPVLFLFVIMTATDSLTASFQLEDKIPYITSLIKRMCMTKKADLKINALKQRTLPLKLKTCCTFMMVLFCLTIEMILKDSHKNSTHIF
jgi:hypothetical protein